jgi:hypothetical protein
MYTITRTANKGVYAKAKPGKDLPSDIFDTFSFAIQAYGHVIAYNEVLTGSQWIDRILEVYSSSPRLERIIQAIKQAMIN